MKIEKNLLTIGEAAEFAGVPIYTIRYWEKEFGGFLNPKRTKGCQRRFCESDVLRISQIKALLKVDKYTISGARQVLEQVRL